MRIAIHIDDEDAVVTTSGVSEDAPPQTADAGAGPGEPGAAAADTDDTGGPPQWLLDVVGAAEAASPAGDDPGPIDDAGAGPEA
jgi:hypothetical protein